MQNLLLIKKFSSAVKDKFHGATKEAAVRRVLKASWNSATSENSSEGFSSLSDFFEDFEQLRLNILSDIFVDEGLASSTQPFAETKPPSPTVFIS